jgi:hypothetical protein
MAAARTIAAHPGATHAQNRVSPLRGGTQYWPAA